MFSYYRDTTSRIVHRRVQPVSSEGEHVCGICGKVFISEATLNDHKHTVHRDYYC